jgi:hypothetical protein
MPTRRLPPSRGHLVCRGARELFDLDPTTVEVVGHADAAPARWAAQRWNPERSSVRCRCRWSTPANGGLANKDLNENPLRARSAVPDYSSASMKTCRQIGNGCAASGQAEVQSQRWEASNDS